MSTVKIIEGEARIKEIDLLISQLQERRKVIADWLENKKSPKPEKIKPDQPYSDIFENLWILYPPRNGIKSEKRAAFNKFLKMKKYNLDNLKAACWNYARSQEAKRGYARDMVRFLKEDYWPQWIKPTEAMLQGSGAKLPTKSVGSIVDEVANAK